MRQHNSSITRVRPYFGQLLSRDKTGSKWLTALLELFTTRGNEFLKGIGNDPGQLLPEFLNKRVYIDKDLKKCGVPNIRLEKCFEFEIPPPKRFLGHLILHPETMVWPKKSKNRERVFRKETQENRKALFQAAHKDHKYVQSRALALLDVLGPSKSLCRWWAFEGATEIDCLLITNKIIFGIEGKRNEDVSPDTEWCPNRYQLFRNIEVISSIADHLIPCFAVISESDIEIPHDALSQSLPHLNDGERKKIHDCYLGNISWDRLQKELMLKSPPDTVEDVARQLSHES